MRAQPSGRFTARKHRGAANTQLLPVRNVKWRKRRAPMARSGHFPWPRASRADTVPLRPPLNRVVGNPCAMDGQSLCNPWLWIAHGLGIHCAFMAHGLPIIGDKSGIDWGLKRAKPLGRQSLGTLGFLSACFQAGEGRGKFPSRRLLPEGPVVDRVGFVFGLVQKETLRLCRRTRKV
jgi:hypothetical protein